MKKFKLTVDVVSHIAQLLQLGIITGTDITAHLLTIVLTESDDPNLLTIDSEYIDNFNKSIETMLNDGDAYIKKLLLDELSNEIPELTSTTNEPKSEDIN